MLRCIDQVTLSAQPWATWTYIFRVTAVSRLAMLL